MSNPHKRQHGDDTVNSNNIIDLDGDSDDIIDLTGDSVGTADLASHAQREAMNSQTVLQKINDMAAQIGKLTTANTECESRCQHCQTELEAARRQNITYGKKLTKTKQREADCFNNYNEMYAYFDARIKAQDAHIQHLLSKQAAVRKPSQLPEPIVQTSHVTQLQSEIVKLRRELEEARKHEPKLPSGLFTSPQMGPKRYDFSQRHSSSFFPAVPPSPAAVSSATPPAWLPSSSPLPPPTPSVHKADMHNGIVDKSTKLSIDKHPDALQALLSRSSIEDGKKIKLWLATLGANETFTWAGVKRSYQTLALSASKSQNGIQLQALNNAKAALEALLWPMYTNLGGCSRRRL